MPEDHYFSADPAAPFERESLACEIWGQWLTLASGAGVYSRGHLDHGTAVLFRELDPPAPGHVLDLGCGYGPIALGIAAAWRAAGETGSVLGVDVNVRAVRLARENAAALGLERTRFLVPGEVAPGETYDEIWSNPPIRIGKQALHDLLLAWLPRLRPGGRAVLVVGKNLGADSLQRWLTEQGWPTVRLGSAKGFRVLESRLRG